MAGHLDNENGVFGRERDEKNKTNLHIKIISHAEAEERAHRPEQSERHGEKDGGGTQVLYLAGAGVQFRDLELPDLPETSSAQFSERVSHAPYLHGVTPLALYAAAAFVVHRNRKKQEASEHHEEDRR